MTYDELSTMTDIKVSASIGIDKFKIDANAEWMRETEDREFTESLNYYVFSQNTVSTGLQGYAKNSLNDLGQ